MLACQHCFHLSARSSSPKNILIFNFGIITYSKKPREVNGFSKMDTSEQKLVLTFEIICDSIIRNFICLTCRPWADLLIMSFEYCPCYVLFYEHHLNLFNESAAGPASLGCEIWAFSFKLLDYYSLFCLMEKQVKSEKWQVESRIGRQNFPISTTSFL